MGLLCLSSSIFACLVFFLLGSAVSAQTPLRALVPLKVGFNEFVSWSGSAEEPTFGGFCVQVFQLAAERLSFDLNYTFVPFGDGIRTPSYDGMVRYVEAGDADAIVADLTINIDRMKLLDFTQPYIQSGLVMITPLKFGMIGSPWDFLRPFSTQLWLAVLAAFFSTGMLLFVLELENTDFRLGQAAQDPNDSSAQAVLAADEFSLLGRSKTLFKRLINVYWFASLSVFFSQQESVKTHTGRFVTLIWLLVVLIFTSSYTASLASNLSSQTPYPTIRDFGALLKSNKPIGFQAGSFIEKYLLMLGVQQHRLKSFDSEAAYASALNLSPEAGGVGAILDELPYVQTFLASECDYTTAGGQIAYFGGFGFAFAKNSSLTDQVSTAILSLAQDGSLQRLRDQWLGSTNPCSANAQENPHMRLGSFGGLFIILACAYVLCFVWRLFTWIPKCQEPRVGGIHS